MAKPSEVLRHAFETHYVPDLPVLAHHERLHRFMCHAVDESYKFTYDDRKAAISTIVEGMRQEMEGADPEVLELFNDAPTDMPLSWVLGACRRPNDAEHCRAWHLALIARLESEGR